MAAPGRLVLKVDVDTFRGTLDGIPRLLDLFEREGIRATFFFSLGPDESGKAIRRIFRKGFLEKMLRARPAASYGVKTMLYGTLLPAPDIGADPSAVRRMREVKTAGHECGIHAWNHVDWHDRLPRMDRAEVETTFSKAASRFHDVFGDRAKLAAAPGWTATPVSVETQEAAGIQVSSDTRGGSPFFPLRTDGTPSTVLEIPTTLPTLDELLVWEEFSGTERLRSTGLYLGEAIARAGGTSIHSVHTEIEGGRVLHGLFTEQVRTWKGCGVEFLPLGEVATGLLAAPERIPARCLSWTNLRGRSTPVATQVSQPPPGDSVVKEPGEFRRAKARRGPAPR